MQTFEGVQVYDSHGCRGGAVGLTSGLRGGVWGTLMRFASCMVARQRAHWRSESCVCESGESQWIYTSSYGPLSRFFVYKDINFDW